RHQVQGHPAVLHHPQYARPAPVHRHGTGGRAVSPPAWPLAVPRAGTDRLQGGVHPRLRDRGRAPGPGAVARLRPDRGDLRRCLRQAGRAAPPPRGGLMRITLVWVDDEHAGGNAGEPAFGLQGVEAPALRMRTLDYDGAPDLDALLADPRL